MARDREAHDRETHDRETHDHDLPDRDITGAQQVGATFARARRRVHPFDTVTLLSDLGTISEHVGVIKATIREFAPEVAIVDLTHDIAPFDVRGGSLALARAAVYLNNGVIIAAVDPGAGPGRRLIGVEVAEGRGVFLGPDNGLLAPAVAIVGGAERAVVLDRQDLQLVSPGAVFAARDILAPVAASLCIGADLNDVGTPVDPSTLVPGLVPIARPENDGLACEVLWVDRFGNCQLNIGREDVDDAFGGSVARVRVSFADATRQSPVVRNVPIVDGFAELGPGGLGLVVDSAGLLCLAVERGSAARDLPLGEGDQVMVHKFDPVTGQVTDSVTGPVTDIATGPVTDIATTPVSNPVSIRQGDRSN